MVASFAASAAAAPALAASAAAASAGFAASVASGFGVSAGLSAGFWQAVRASDAIKAVIANLAFIHFSIE